MIVRLIECDYCGLSAALDRGKKVPAEWSTTVDMVNGKRVEHSFCCQACHMSFNGHERETLYLSGRDKRIIELIARGLENKMIGQELCLAESTIKNKISTIFDWLGTSNRIEAILVAHALGLVNLHEIAFQTYKGLSEDGLRKNARFFEQQRKAGLLQEDHKHTPATVEAA